MTRKKQKRSGLSLTNNKAFFGSFMALITFVLIINATFAWSSYAKWLHNKMQSPNEKDIRVAVQGNLSGNVLTNTSGLSPQVRVKNIGEAPAFIRVSLEEVLLTLAVDTTDQTGNGHLAEYADLGGKTEVKLETPSTWQINARYTPDKLVYYETKKLATYEYKQTETNRPMELGYLDYTWGMVDPLTPPVSGYWLYEEINGRGYYFYSQSVQPGNQTTVLVDQVHLKNRAPNGLKGSLYRLDIHADGGQVNEGVYDDWGITKLVGNRIYDCYEAVLGGEGT
ncbi:hypothetical protein I6N95_24820 [Vagococcus sp. BWB3-3]|uniref:Alternate signal-mediated exported protein n=1 Tax=Vagococcus allomyrinae TaxID=2794353 RepID=A0A940PGL3_9ENTE|nr:hypothetical protein [Vagococcus allomyrinae]MBP1044237.1 hypothetical protein [Vagococcus allomyrinae]